MASDPRYPYRVTITQKANQPMSVLNPRAVSLGQSPNIGMKQGLSTIASPFQQMAPPPRRTPAGYFSGGWPVPLMTSGMTFSEVGQSGLRQFGGWVREEFLPQLVGRQAARTYREMADNSAVVGGLLFAITATMRKVETRVEPANDTGAAAEMADFVETCLVDMSHSWEDHVVELLTMLPYGFAPHEIVYKRRLGRKPGPDLQRDPTGKTMLPKSNCDDGRIGWRRLPLRGQDTIIKWFFGPNGEILGMTQQPWIGALTDIPIEKLLIFRPAAHKNNPEGRSVLRSAYRSWYLSKRLEEQEAILFERISGLPIVKIPSQVFEDAANGAPEALAKLASFKQIATNLRVDDQMGVVLPSDTWPGTNGPSQAPMYSLELAAPQGRGRGPDSDKAIERYNVNMMTSVLADFLQLGHQSRGTQSLAVAKADMFFLAVEGFLNSAASVHNRYGLERLWDLNGLDYDLIPQITPDLAQRIDLDMLSNFILRLSQAGMPMFPDAELEQWTRDQAGMPDIADEDAMRYLQEAAVGIKDPEDPNSPTHPDHPDNPLNRDPANDDAATNGERKVNAIVKSSIIRRLMRMNGAVGTTRQRARIRRKASGGAIRIVRGLEAGVGAL